MVQARLPEPVQVPAAAATHHAPPAVLATAEVVEQSAPVATPAGEHAFALMETASYMALAAPYLLHFHMLQL